jgi:hypothetical protein
MAWIQEQGLILRYDFSLWIDGRNGFELLHEFLFKVALSLRSKRIPCPKLQLQGFPGNRDGFIEIAHTVGKPAIDIERHGRPFQGLKGPHIDGNGVVGHLFEKTLL